MLLKTTNQRQAMNADSLRQLCSKHSIGTVVSRVENGLPDWIFDNGGLRNTKADYFSVGLYVQEAGDSLLLMKQKETALVMLLVCNIDGQDNLLLSLRTEPGLIGLTNYSTTIQSTPSNYLRKHGGKRTPFIEFAMDPGYKSNVLYEGTHHDWGDYYLNKTKKFLIVELESPVKAPTGFCWVTLETANVLLRENHLVTNDLRVAIPLLNARGVNNSVGSEGELSLAGSRQLLRSIELSPGAIDSRGTGVSFFITETQTREVGSWVQPLLIPKSNMKISLAFANSPQGRIYAIEERTQPGLLGHQLWFPVNKDNGKVVRSVKTSAEGGRFWRHQIEIELIEIENPCDTAADAGVSERWISEQSLSLLVSQSLQTSLELRMAWSLAYAGGVDAP
jgi:hypothetical protein